MPRRTLRCGASPGRAVVDTSRLDEPYRRILDGSLESGEFTLSADGLVNTWNAAAERTFGYASEEVLGRPHSLFFTAEDVAAGRPATELQTCVESGQASAEGWHVRKDGSRVWCTDILRAVRDRAGAVTGFSKIVLDSTESYLARQRLRESEEQLRVLVEGISDYAVFSIDVDGRILLWNQGAQRLFGYSEAEALGKHFSLVYPQEAIARRLPEAEIAAAARHGQSSNESWHVRRGGGRFFASGATTRLEPDVEGRPRGFIKIVHDLTARKTSDETIRRQAFHDELTGLPNRAYFSDCLNRAIARTKRRPQSRFAVVFLDLDRFKVLNDSLGHALADGLLVHVGQTLARCVRPDDVVARLGGDEFAILLTEIDGSGDVTRVAERIQTALQIPLYLDGFEVFTSASMGIAIGSAAYDEAQDVLRDADTAMYEAKARGRSQHVVFDFEMHARAVGLLNLQMDLRRAIARREFFVEYQPVVELEQGRVVGLEALVRWDHPDRGILLPGAFIAEAENIGLIVEIDLFVLHEACRQLRAWQVAFDAPELTVSVNISSKTFGRHNLIAEIAEALALNGLTASSLKLEITETVLLERFESTMETVGRIRALGVDLHIDDFGTGYSSLSYLTRLPLKLLKVDRSFVNQITADPRGVEIARTIVTMAHNLGLLALAEGIETEEQASCLRDLGCEFGQGFWFSRAVPPEFAERTIGRTLPERAPGPERTARDAAEPPKLDGV